MVLFIFFKHFFKNVLYFFYFLKKKISNFLKKYDQPLPQLFRHPGAKNHICRIFPAIFGTPILLEKFEKYDFLLQGAWTIGVKVGHFQWFWLGTTKKALFLTHFFNFGPEGAPNVTKITYNMKIWWENSPRKKNWGSFVHRGLSNTF